MDQPDLLAASYIRWIVLLPLIGAVVNGILGRKIQKLFGEKA